LIVASHGRTPWPISIIFRGFYTTNYPTLAFQIWRDSLHRLRSNCWETARRSIRPNFSVHPVGKTMCWIKKWFIQKWFPSFLMVSTCSITMQILGEIVQRAPAVGAKMWCLFFFGHAPSPEHCAFQRCIVLLHRITIYRPISTRFSALFSEGIALSDALHSSHFRR